MFFVFNKEKIYSYLVALTTVVILFVIAFMVGTNDQMQQMIQTSAYVSRLLPIYNVETKEKKVALTINCAWNANDIDTILATLNKYQTKVTFFMVGDWIERYPESAKKIAEAGHELRKSFGFTSTCK